MQSPHAVWNTYIDALNRHDLDAVMDVLDDDFVYDERPMTMANPLRGKLAYHAYFTRLFSIFPDLSIEITSYGGDAHLSVSESIMRGTQSGKIGLLPASGKCMTARVACVFEVAKGKLTYERLYWDRANTLRQFGLLPAVLGVASRKAVTF